MAGKGSKQRPTDHKKFSENYDRIFSKQQTRKLVTSRAGGLKQNASTKRQSKRT